MAAYGVNQAYTSTGNPLCDRLKRKYADRGAAQVTRRTASTSTMIKRVQHGLDPYENAPNPLTEKRPVAQAAMQRSQMADARVSSAPAKAGAASARPAVKSAAAGAKSAPTVKTAARPMPQKKAAAKSAAVRTEIKRSRSAAAAARTAQAETPMEEIALARAPFPFAAVMMATILVVMVMSVFYIFIQNYELSSEISALEAQQQELAEKEREMTLLLEKRDDIRLIEDIAVNEIGMVKNDLVENRFVSVSGGNRVEVASYEDEEDGVKRGIFSTMLSAIGENFEKIREYID